jgi:hypothetical protein
MDLASIFRDTWRITWHSRPLWILSLLMSLTMLPALALAGAFGGAASAISLSAPGYLMGLARLRELPAWAWILIAAGMWVLLVVLTTVSWTLQVAMVRGASLAAEGQPPTLVKALSLGPQRLQSIVKLGLTFGVLMMALSVLPPLAEVLLSQLARGQAGLVGLVPLTQTGLAPVSSALSLALFLVMMSSAMAGGASCWFLRSRVCRPSL